MRMIPSQPNGKQTFTEQKVFGLLSRAEWHPGSACLSSLNLSEHEYKSWGEADFVLVGSHGLLVLEVKGGSVSCSEGIWRYESSRFGPVTRRESPYTQAHGALMALSTPMKEKFGGSLGSSHGGFAVIFATMSRRQMESIVGGPETPSEITGYSEDLASPEALLSFLRRVEQHWAHRLQGRLPEWPTSVCERVLQFLRPSFERVPPLSLRIAQVRDERLQLTEEQYYALDRMDACDRLLVTASAGCGKTLLAAESVRREVGAGRRVALVTGTEHLAEYMRLGSDIGEIAQVQSYRDFIASGPSAQSFDALIIDEGQQLTTRECLSHLERRLDGGLERGRWRWFTDPNRQVAADSDFDVETMELLRLLANHEVPLLQNCRNTEQVVVWAEQASGVPIGRPLIRGRGQKVVLEKGRDRAQVREAVSRRIAKLLAMDAKPSEMVVLWVGERGREDAESACRAVGLQPTAWTRVFARGEGAPANAIALSSILEFRGLEGEHVLILGLEEASGGEELRRLLYLAVTRAMFSVGVFALPATYAMIRRFLEEGLAQRLVRRG